MTRLLFNKAKKVQLWLAAIGSLFGITLLVIAFQAFLDFSELLQPSSGIVTDQYIIINKQISMLNTLGMNSAVFSKDEIEKIRQQPEVKSAAPFTPNLFRAGAFTDGGMNGQIMPFYTEMFFESLPDEFIDAGDISWRWQQGQPEVPVIVPSDYINLYNFGFAPSQGLPQLSKGTVKMATFKIKVRGRGQEAIFKGRIAGFTDKINSILVPIGFIQYANENFGDKVDKGPSRIAIISKNSGSAAFIKFLSDNGYETNSENKNKAKFYSILQIIFTILLFVGGVIVLLSVLGFIQYGQLLIARSDYEIKTLIQLGYKHQNIAAAYNLFFAKLYAFILIGALLIVTVCKFKFNHIMQASGFEVEGWPAVNTFIFGAGVMLLLYFIGSISIKKSVKALALVN